MKDENLKYDGKFIKITEQVIDGNIWEKAYYLGAVVAYPLTDHNEILFVEEHRPHETPQIRLKPVTGHWEKDYDLIGNANKEMQEEIGYKGNKYFSICEYKSTGSINNFQKFVLVGDLEKSKIPNPDGEDSIRKVIPIPFDQLEKMIHEEDIPWSYSLMGLMRLFYLCRNKDIQCLLKPI